MKNEKLIKKILLFLIFTTILFSPLYVVRWQYFGLLPTTLLETLILATVAVWGVSKILRRDFSLPKTAFDKPILLFLVAAIISLFVTPDLRGGLGVFKAYILEPVLFFYIMIDTFSLYKGVIKSEALDGGSTKAILWALILSGLWVSLLGIVQTLFGIGIVTPHEAAAGRAHGVYNTGNALGLYVGPIFALGVGMLFQKLKTQNSKLPPASLREALRAGKTTTKMSKLFNSLPFLIFSLFSLLFAIFLSKSTGALVGLVAVFAVFLIFRVVRVRHPPAAGSRRIWGFRVMGIMGVIGVIVGILFFLNISRFTPNVDNPWERTSESTLTTRLCLWEGTKNLLFDSPIFGAGLSGFKELYSQKYFTCDAEPLEYPHNLFLDFWVELGFLGLLGFLAILWVYFETVKKVEGVEKIALTAAMVYWLIHGLVDVPYFKNDLALEFWVIIALSEILRGRQSLPYQTQ